METVTKAGTSNAEMVTITRAEYEAMQAQINWFMEQMRLLKKKTFGASSEKSHEEILGQLSLLFDEAELQLLSGDEKEAETASVVGYARKKRTGGVTEMLPENVPVEVVEHRPPENMLNCPKCGAVMTEIGKEVRRSLLIIPAQVKIREDWYFTYGCPNCKLDGTETPILKTEKAPSVIPGSYASPEAIAHIMVQKFVMGSPLYRQEQELNRSGVMLSRQTMSNWILRAADDWLKPIYDELHRQLLQHQVLHADETTLQVLHEDGKKAQSKSYMWLYRTGGDAGQPIVLYEYKSRQKG